MTSSERNISAKDVKDKLFQSLKTRGVLDSLKSQLRKQLIWELQDTTGLPLLQSERANPSASKAPKAAADSTVIPLFQRISNSIVAEHLQRCNYEYTLSTFLPESGTSSDKMFADKDVLHFLHINSESKLFRHLERSQSSQRDSKGFLWHFLLEIAALHNNSKCDAENQTEETLPTRSGSLEEKLSDVEKEFSEKLRLFELDKNQGMEEKLFAVQKKYEVQKRKELEEEIKKIKMNEISRLKLEEREKYEFEIKKLRQEYEQEFNLKHQALKAMEKEMLERMNRQQEVKESEAYSERQKMLQEMQSLKQKEKDLNNRIELQERSQKVEEQRLQNDAEQLQALEGALKEREKLQEQKYKEEVARFMVDYEKQFTTRRQDLLRHESRLEAEKLKLESEREKYLQCQDDLTVYREKNVQLQTSVGTARMLLENINKQKTAMEEKLTAMKDYEALKEKEIIFKKDIEHLTQRLADTNTHWKEQDKKQERLVKELTDKAGKPSKEVIALRKELKDGKEKFKLREKSSNESRRKIEQRLNMEIQRANHFQNLCEDHLSSQGLMETEITNLKMMLQQTEQLLNMDIRQQKKNDSDMSLSSSITGYLKRDTITKVDCQEISIQKYETDESCTVDESSLVSLAEDKKIFEKLDREAEVLDASYRDFQNRMRVTQHHSVSTMPSSMTFRRLPSYHSFHSPDKVASAKEIWINPDISQDKFEYRPMTLYRGSSTSEHLPSQFKDKRRSRSAVLSKSSIQRLSSERMHSQDHHAAKRTHDSNEMLDSKVEPEKLTADEADALTVKDLAAVPSSSANNSKNIKKHEQIIRGSSSSTARLLMVEKENELISTQKVVSSEENDGDRSRKEHHSKNETELNNKEQDTSHSVINKSEQVSVDTSRSVINKSDRVLSPNRTLAFDAENLVVNKKTTNAVAFSAGKLNSESESSVDGAVRGKSRTSDKTLEDGSNLAFSKEHESGELLGSGEETTLDGMWERREQSQVKGRVDKSGSLDMDELEERRRNDLRSSQVSGDSENSSEEGLDDFEQQSGSDDSVDPNLSEAELTISAEKNDVDKNHDQDNLEHEGDDQDPTIDPMMLKYMEMIKQRRENEPKDVEKTASEDHRNQHVMPTDQDVDSYISLGKEDDDVSIGKLSDEDFNWE